MASSKNPKTPKNPKPREDVSKLGEVGKLNALSCRLALRNVATQTVNNLKLEGAKVRENYN